MLKLNKLSINVTKSKCLVFRQPRKTVVIREFEIDDNNIEVVAKFVFGLNIIINLNWKNHTDCISTKISRRNWYYEKVKTCHPFRSFGYAL